MAGHPRFQISIENASLFQWKFDGLVGSCKGFHQDSEIVSRGGILYHTWPTSPGFLFRIYLVALHPGILYHTVPNYQCPARRFLFLRMCLELYIQILKKPREKIKCFETGHPIFHPEFHPEFEFRLMSHIPPTRGGVVFGPTGGL